MISDKRGIRAEPRGKPRESCDKNEKRQLPSKSHKKSLYSERDKRETETAGHNNESFGFRPNRNCHQAVREILEMIQYCKTNYVVEADIRGFFDNEDHEWLLKMLKHDIAVGHVRF